MKPDDLKYILSKISPGTTLVVEGKRDADALRSLGFKSAIPIYGKPLTELTDIVVKNMESHGGKVAVLTDFDAEGERQAQLLTEMFEQRHIETDPFARTAFRNAFHDQEIEGVDANFRLFSNGGMHFPITNTDPSLAEVMGMDSDYQRFIQFTDSSEVINHGQAGSIDDKVFNRIRFLGRRPGGKAGRDRGGIRSDGRSSGSGTRS